MKAQATIILLFFIITMYTTSCIVNSQTMERNLKTFNAGIPKIPIQKGQKYEFYNSLFCKYIYSSSNIQPQRIKLYNNYRSNIFDNPLLFYNNFDADFEKHLSVSQPTNNEDSSNSIEINKRVSRNRGYDDYKTSQTTHVVGPHQTETIQSEHFHKKVPAFDVSGFQPNSHEKHTEVLYHERKHFHKHEHKQEHAHQQKHEYKHLHSQNHKHEHNSKNNHEHEHKHKHDHHQQHKHQHHHGYKYNH